MDGAEGKGDGTMEATTAAKDEVDVIHLKLRDKGSGDDNIVTIKEGAKKEDPSSRGVGVDIRVSVDGASGKGDGTMEATTAAEG